MRFSRFLREVFLSGLESITFRIPKKKAHHFARFWGEMCLFNEGGMADE